MKQNCNDCGGESLACVAENAGSPCHFRQVNSPGVLFSTGNLGQVWRRNTKKLPIGRVTESCRSVERPNGDGVGTSCSVVTSVLRSLAGVNAGAGVDLLHKMRSQLGFRELTIHAASAELAPLDEESALAAAVNARTAAGFKLDEREEIEAAEELAAATAAAAVAAAVDLESRETRERRSELRAELANVAFLFVLITVIGFGLFVLNDGAEVRGLPLCKRSPPLPV